MEAEREHELETPAAERNSDRLGVLGPIHLAVCLGVGGLVVLAINLMEWLG